MSNDQRIFHAAEPTVPNDKEFYELIRRQIEYEDSLINHRMTWLLSLQAFLFAAYGFSLSAESNRQVNMAIINIARVGFAWMAFFSSAVLLCGIAAAALSMRSLVKQWHAHWLGRTIAEKRQYPQIIGTAVPFLGMWGGLLPTYFLPLTSAGVWAWLVQDNISVWYGFAGVILFFVLGLIILAAYEHGKRSSTSW